MRQEDLISHYQQIADSIDIPFVLYNIPQFCNPLRVDTMLRVIENCEPVALKNSNTDVTEMMALLHGLRQTTVSYLVGPDELLFTGLELGAHGSMSGLTGTIPEGVRNMIDAHRAGRSDLARRIQYAFLELLQLIADLPFPFSLKVMLDIRGFEMGPPVQAQSEATHKRIEERKPAIARQIQSILKLLA